MATAMRVPILGPKLNTCKSTTPFLLVIPKYRVFLLTQKPLTIYVSTTQKHERRHLNGLDEQRKRFELWRPLKWNRVPAVVTWHMAASVTQNGLIRTDDSHLPRNAARVSLNPNLSIRVHPPHSTFWQLIHLLRIYGLQDIWLGTDASMKEDSGTGEKKDTNYRLTEEDVLFSVHAVS